MESLLTSGPAIPIKRQRFIEQDSIIYCLKEKHLKYKETDINKCIGTVYHTNSIRRLDLVILISNKHKEKAYY